MKLLLKALQTLRNPSTRRVLLWNARRVMILVVALIETVLRDGSEAITLA